MDFTFKRFKSLSILGAIDQNHFKQNFRPQSPKLKNETFRLKFYVSA